MDWKTELLTSRIDLVSALFGGLGVALIAWFSAKYSHHLRLSSEKSAELRKKLEELVYLCTETDHWVSKQQQHYLGDGPKELTPNPAEKIRAIAHLYFPDLLGMAQYLEMRVVLYVLFLGQIKNRLRSEKFGWLSDEEEKSLEQKSQNMHQAKTRIEESARDLMEKLLSGKPATDGRIRRWFNKLRRN